LSSIEQETNRKDVQKSAIDSTKLGVAGSIDQSQGDNNMFEVIFCDPSEVNRPVKKSNCGIYERNKNLKTA